MTSPATAQALGGLQVTIPLPGISNTTLRVQARLGWTFQVALNSSDGFVNGKPAPCNSRPYSYDNVTREYEWAYNASAFQFAFENISSNDRTDQGRTVTRFGPPTPVPFVKNNTTGYYYSHTYGGVRVCDAQSTADIVAFAYLIDKSTGSYLAPTGDTVGNTFGSILDASVQVENMTDWSCTSSRLWYGPANYSSITPTTCSSLNASTYSLYFALPGTAVTSISTNNSQPWNGRIAGSGRFWWNSSSIPTPFSTLDHYDLEISLAAILGATNSWPKGVASWAFDMASLGDGTVLRSVSIS